jgi:hypothetical protein
MEGVEFPEGKIRFKTFERAAARGGAGRRTPLCG